MGLVQKFKGIVSSAFLEQYEEFVYCAAFDAGVLVQKGKKRAAVGASYSDYGSGNMITPQSNIIVSEGQALLVVENAQIIDFAAEAGAYTFKQDKEPSLFAGELKNLLDSFRKVGHRFTYGEQHNSGLQAYSVNLKEVPNNKFGVGNVAFRDAELGFTVYLKGYGVYCYKIEDPLLFFANAAADISDEYSVSDLDDELKAQFQQALQAATGNLSFSGITYNTITKHTKELTRSMDKMLEEKWKKTRGLTLLSIDFISIKPDEASSKKIAELKEKDIYNNIFGAKENCFYGEQTYPSENNCDNISKEKVNAENNAAEKTLGVKKQNTLSADYGFKAGNAHIGHKTEISESSVWVCSCGNVNSGNFCPECGKKRLPKCSHSRAREGDTFCADCGAKLR